MLHKLVRMPFFWVLLLFFAVHLFLGIYIAQKHTEFFLHDDGAEYLELAKSFADSATFTAKDVRYYEAPRTGPVPEAFRSLLLPMAGGIFIRIFSDPLTATAILQTILATALGWIFFAIGTQITQRESGGWFAFFLYAVHPLMIVFTFRFSSELFFILFLALFLHAFLKPDSLSRSVKMGLFGGLSALVRPTTVLLLPAYLIFELCMLAAPVFFGRERAGNRTAVTRDYILFASVFLLCVLPIAVRNQYHFGTFNPTSYLGGFNLFVGNNRDNLKAYQANTGAEFLKHQNAGWNRAIEIAKQFPENLPPAEQQERFTQKAKEELSGMSCAEKWTLFSGKAWHFLRPWPLPNAHPGVVFIGIFLFETMLFVFGFLGLWKWRNRPALILFFAMLIAVGWSAHTAVHLQMRHRVPFLDLCMILAAAEALSGYFRKLCDFLRNRIRIPLFIASAIKILALKGILRR